MDVSQEIELKLRYADPAVWGALIFDPLVQDMAVQGSQKEVKLETFYYDTPGRDLKKAHIAFRVRKSGGTYEATVKTSDAASGGGACGPMQERTEWNAQADSLKPDIECFRGSPIYDRINDAIGAGDGGKLAVLFSTHITRRVALLTARSGGQIELALDRGFIASGRMISELGELELELKNGADLTDAISAAAAIARRYPLIIDHRSKYARGLELAGLASDETEAVCEAPIQGSSIERLNRYLYNIFTLLNRSALDPDDDISLGEARKQFGLLCSTAAEAGPEAAVPSLQRLYDLLCKDSGKFVLKYGAGAFTPDLLDIWREIIILSRRIS